MSAIENIGNVKDGALRSTAHLSPFVAERLKGFDDPFFTEAGLQVCPSVFQSPDLIKSLLSTIGKARGAELVLIGVRDASSRPIALFPFSRRRRYGAQVIEGLDFEVADYFAPPFLGNVPLTGAETGLLWQAVCRALPPADALTFKKLPRTVYGRPHALSGASFLRAMGAYAYMLKLRTGTEPKAISISDLPAGRDVRRKKRKLGSIGEVRFTEAQSADEIALAINTLIALRRERFANLRRPDLLADASVESFYRALLDRSSAPQLGRVFLLQVDAEIVSVVYALTHARVLTLVIPTMSSDPRWQSGSPGLVALGELLNWAGDQGYQIFDFSVGSSEYKARFSTEKIELFEYQQALSPLGLPIILDALMRRWGRRFRERRPFARTLPSWLPLRGKGRP